MIGCLVKMFKRFEEPFYILSAMFVSGSIAMVMSQFMVYRRNHHNQYRTISG
jgi:hypothetical protein